MQVPCIKDRDTSKPCSNCFPNPFFAQPYTTNLPTDNHNPQQEFVLAIVSSVHPPNAQFTNHESLPSLPESLSCLTKACPQYLKTSIADQIRSQEYYHLSVSNRVCLDYIGNGLFSYSQQEVCQKKISGSGTSDAIASTSSTPPPPLVRQFSFADQEVQFFNISYRSGNLNSQLLCSTSQESEFESSMRRRIMRYMNLSEYDYSMVFTANQASAFKLLAESYPFESHQNLLTVYDHKNESVEAMKESCKKKQAQTMSAEFSWPSLRINSRKLRKMILQMGNKKKRGLFVFPLQSRITGARYSYLWMNMAQQKGWHILLDVDSLGAKPMDTIGLSLFRPDFLICSFFKIFGENPSGFSCLFVKKSRISLLNKSPRGIGIVSLVTPTMSRQSAIVETETEDQEKSAIPKLMEEEVDKSIRLQLPSLGEMLKKELSFSVFENLNQPKNLNSEEEEEAECRGLDHADKISLILINSRARYHVNWLINALVTLQHPHSENGVPLIRIYGPKLRFDRGSAVAFNVFDWKGEKIDPTLVQKLADRNNISVACGFLQHIWFSDTCNEELKEQILSSSETDKKRGKSGSGSGFGTGISVVTVSIGFLTNFEDLYRLWVFVSRFLDADFVEKERWRYMALNQTTVEV